MSKKAGKTLGLRVVVKEAEPSPDDRAHLSAGNRIVFDPMMEGGETQAGGVSGDVSTVAPEPEPLRPAPRRVIYGSCSRCKADAVSDDGYGSPLCSICGWNGQTVSGDQVERLPEGTPPGYEGSRKVESGNLRRMDEYRARQRRV